MGAYQIGDRVLGCPVCRDEGEGCGVCIVGSGWGAGEAEIDRDHAAWWARTHEVGCSCTDPNDRECWDCEGDLCPCHLFPALAERPQEVIYVPVPRSRS